MPNLPAPSQRYSGISDLRQLDEILAILKQVEAPLVSALPASPVDGQQVRYQNALMAEQGVEWHLVYRAASASEHKWEFLGGQVLKGAQVAGGEIETVGGNQEVPGAPTLVIPLNGEYVAGVDCYELQLTSAALAQAVLKPGETALLVTNAFFFAATDQFSLVSAFGHAPLNLVGGNTLKLFIEGTKAVKWSVAFTTLTLLPIRLG